MYSSMWRMSLRMGPCFCRLCRLIGGLGLLVRAWYCCRLSRLVLKPFTCFTGAQHSYWHVEGTSCWLARGDVPPGCKMQPGER